MRSRLDLKHRKLKSAEEVQNALQGLPVATYVPPTQTEVVLMRNFLRDEDIPLISASLNPTLTSLYLGANLLTFCPDLHVFEQLRVLHINNNALKRFECREGLMALEELDLRANEIDTLEGFPDLPKLEWLSVACNKLQDLRGLPGKMRYLGLFGNYLVSFDETLAVLSQVSGLEEVFLSGNGWDDLPSYRDSVLSHLPIRKLDGVVVS